jgi:hypothetical protein
LNGRRVETDGRAVDSFRGLVTAFAVVGIAWQLAVITLSLRHAGALASATEALGIALPIATRSFLATYQWWIALPVLSVAAAYSAYRHAATAPKRAIAAAIVPLVVAAALQTWVNEAALSPLRSILNHIR